VKDINSKPNQLLTAEKERVQSAEQTTHTWSKKTQVVRHRVLHRHMFVDVILLFVFVSFPPACVLCA